MTRRRAELYLLDRLRGLTWKAIAHRHGVRLDTCRKTMQFARRQWHCESEGELIGIWLIFGIISLKEVYDRAAP